MDLQNKILEKVGADKLLHFFIMSYISLLLLLFIPVSLTLILSTSIIIVKEDIDKYYRNSEFSYKDIIAGGLGVILSLLVYMFL